MTEEMQLALSLAFYWNSFWLVALPAGLLVLAWLIKRLTKLSVSRDICLEESEGFFMLLIFLVAFTFLYIFAGTIGWAKCVKEVIEITFTPEVYAERNLR